MDDRLLMNVTYCLLAMPVLLVCIFGIVSIRKRSTVKSVRLTASLGLSLIAVLALLNAVYNANFDVVIGELTMITGMHTVNFLAAVFTGMSKFITAIAIALLTTAVFLKVKFANP
jgi:hypothetical protein